MYLLLPLIMMVSVVGVYSANQAVLDLVLLCVFGVIGYFMRRNGFSIVPVILGFVLGGRMGKALRQSMIMTQGDLFQHYPTPYPRGFSRRACDSGFGRHGAAEIPRPAGRTRTR
jgi:putative tricarboxylic transport membrane protein